MPSQQPGARSLCGHEREGDVPGFEIPARYFRLRAHRRRTAAWRRARAQPPRPPVARDAHGTRRAAARRRRPRGHGARGARHGTSVRASRNDDGSDGLFRESGSTWGRDACPEALMRMLSLLDVCVATKLRQIAWRRFLDSTTVRLPRARSVRGARRSSRTPATQSGVRAPPGDASLLLDMTHARREAIEHRLARLDRSSRHRACTASAC